MNCLLESPDYNTNILCSGCFTRALALRRSVVLLLLLYETVIKKKKKKKHLGGLNFISVALLIITHIYTDLRNSLHFDR